MGDRLILLGSSEDLKIDRAIQLLGLSGFEQLCTLLMNVGWKLDPYVRLRWFGRRVLVLRPSSDPAAVEARDGTRVQLLVLEVRAGRVRLAIAPAGDPPAWNDWVVIVMTATRRIRALPKAREVWLVTAIS
jgi:hypothetical protein